MGDKVLEAKAYVLDAQSRVHQEHGSAAFLDQLLNATLMDPGSLCAWQVSKQSAERTFAH